MEEISNFERQTTKIETKKEKLQVFVSQNEIINLIKRLEKTAAETGNEAIIEDVEIKNEKAKKESKNKKIRKNTEKNKKMFSLPSNNYIKIKINLRGSYNDFINFVRKIENMDYYSDIISLHLFLSEYYS